MNALVTHHLETPLGRAIAAATQRGICMLEFGDDDRVDRQLDALEEALEAEAAMGASPLFQQLELELTGYFEGTRRSFEIALHTPGTAFQERVWEALQEIPFGQTTSYRNLAHQINAPSAMRAVGGANGANRVSVLVPCHRVIGADGSLTGFGGGIELKKRLLDHERAVSGESLWSAEQSSSRII